MAALFSDFGDDCIEVLCTHFAKNLESAGVKPADAHHEWLLFKNDLYAVYAYSLISILLLHNVYY